jgi:serine/threonine protein kinase
MKVFRKSALKKKDRNAYLDTLKEIDILKTFNHPNVIRLHEVIDDDPGDKLYLVLDYAEKG